MNDPSCAFCKIVTGDLTADIVYRDDRLIAFLDNRPLFPGHVLLCPVDHIATLIDVPESLTNHLMRTTQLLAGAVERALQAEGSFVAINNRVSQSVPHLHIHVVPRKRRDGLKGFFWPRRNYTDPAERESVRVALANDINQQLA